MSVSNPLGRQVKLLGYSGGWGSKFSIRFSLNKSLSVTKLPGPVVTGAGLWCPWLGSVLHEALDRVLGLKRGIQGSTE